jgi:hypothetical protein
MPNTAPQPDHTNPFTPERLALRQRKYHKGNWHAQESKVVARIAENIFAELLPSLTKNPPKDTSHD